MHSQAATIDPPAAPGAAQPRRLAGAATRASLHPLAFAIILIVSACWMWISSWDHPLYPPDEGRYGSVSLRMAEGGSWLLPEFEGHVHLTKPPLLYWAQAMCIRWLGATELAVRMPSLLASSLLVVATGVLGLRLGGRRVGATAAALLSIMPLHIAVGRLAITDATMSLCWFGILASGYLALETGRRRWVVLLWFSAAMGLMTKGPVALTPILVLVLWLALTRRWRDIRLLHPLVGLPLAAVSILLWIWLVVRTNPDAWEIWKRQIVDRAVGSGDHPEPLWFYLPIFLAGMFPGTAMLTIPGWNLSLQAAWEKLRGGDPAGLLALGVLVPLVMFTLISGKLASYLMPIAPPMALLTALMLERWFNGESDHPPQGTRPPEVVATLTVCLALMPIAALIAAIMLNPPLIWTTLPLFSQPLASAWVWWSWKRRPQRRPLALVVLWIVMLGCWCFIFEAEDNIVRPLSAATLLDKLRTLTGSPQPTIATYGFSDSTIAFYNHRPTTRLKDAQEVRRSLMNPEPDFILIVDNQNWEELAQSEPALTAQFTPIQQGRLGRVKATTSMRPKSMAEQAAPADGPSSP